MTADTPSQPIDLELWERVLAGGATPDEVARVQAWVFAVAGDPPVAEQLRQAVWQLEVAAGGARILEPAAFVEKLRGQIAADAVPSVRTARAVSTKRDRRPIGSWVPMAAAAAVVLVVGVAWHAGLLRSGGDRIAHEYVAAPGERVTLSLTDGSEVMLAPASRLRVPVNFAASRRVVLEGEGYFTVRHDAAHPFAVQTAAGETRDVGTVFDVRAYPQDLATRVVVAEGSVAVEGAPVVAGEMAVVRAGMRPTVTPGVNVGAYLDWRSGRLVLRAATVADAARELARWYGLQVVIADTALAARHVTATFEHETPEDVVRILAHALDAHATLTGRDVVLSLGPITGDRDR